MIPSQSEGFSTCFNFQNLKIIWLFTYSSNYLFFIYLMCSFIFSFNHFLLFVSLSALCFHYSFFYSIDSCILFIGLFLYFSLIGLYIY